jgi:hypothetical protein
MDDVAVKDLFNYGVPTGLLLLTMFGLWRMLLWAKTNVVEPVVRSHLALITSLTENVPRQSEKLTRVADAASAVALKQEQQLREIQETLKAQTGILEGAINYQTSVIEDRKARAPDPGSIHRVQPQVP